MALPSGWLKWILIGVAVLIVISFLVYRPDRKLTDMVKEDIVKDQADIQKDLDGQIERLDQEKGNLLKELNNVKGERDALKKERQRVLERLAENQAGLNSIAVPNDPDGLVDEFRSRGLGSVHRVRPIR